MMNENARFNAAARLMDEAEQTLHAIRYGAVDAFVVEEAEGHRVYALEGADLPYHTLVERMQQGAAMLDARGCIIYCNLSLAKLLGVPRDTAIGIALRDFIAAPDRPACQKLLEETLKGSSEGEMRLHRGDDQHIAANFSFKLLSQDKSAVAVLITDLTERKEQIELASRLQQMQDDERRRIARELHDSVGQLLVAIGMNIATIQPQMHKLDAMGSRAIEENAQLIDQVSREIRTVSYLLHPPLLDVAGLISALRLYLDGFSERSNIKVDLDVPPDFSRLPDAVEIAVFRMVQECLTNIHRHSGSPTAAIRIHQKGGRLTVEVQDTGKGIPKERQSELPGSGRSGVGFAGMRERLTQLGGKLEIQSSENGTTVRALVPIESTNS
ncbi:MAG: ATP-binding protein [Candidatus Sulfotelmatobacter sp.]